MQPVQRPGRAARTVAIVVVLAAVLVWAGVLITHTVQSRASVPPISSMTTTSRGLPWDPLPPLTTEYTDPAQLEQVRQALQRHGWEPGREWPDEGLCTDQSSISITLTFEDGSTEHLHIDAADPKECMKRGGVWAELRTIMLSWK